MAKGHGNVAELLLVQGAEVNRADRKGGGLGSWTELNGRICESNSQSSLIWQNNHRVIFLRRKTMADPCIFSKLIVNPRAFECF